MPLWVAELADAFWAAAGGPEPVPRDLRVPIATALPLTVVLLPRLGVAAVDTWLRRRGIPRGLAVTDRPLRACLVARSGHGIILLEGTDPEDEQRFSLAHELAHFLRHYWQPRREVAALLGPGVLAVLDGDRAPRPDERIHALLAHVPLGFHVHLMARTPAGGVEDAATDLAERDADLLAWELLAASMEVVRAVPTLAAEERRAAVTHLLTTGYGLPAAPARRYAALLVPATQRPDSLIRRLGLVP